MRDISKIKTQLEVRYAQKYCHVKDTGKCPYDHCTCRVAAEIRALMETVIPDPYHKYTINDFHGHSDGGDKLISTSIAQRAKKQLAQYCWKDIGLEKLNALDSQGLDEISLMDKRREEGKNVIIYSNPESGSGIRQSGKTFIASLIMKEAIKRRLVPGNHVQQYDWIQYSRLKELIKQDDLALATIRSCDWLVVDDIIKDEMGRKAQAYVSALIDPFFVERLEDGLPTILVFRFDVEKRKKLLEEEFGVAVSKIVNNSKTHRISLCEKENE